MSLGQNGVRSCVRKRTKGNRGVTTGSFTLAIEGYSLKLYCVSLLKFCDNFFWGSVPKNEAVTEHLCDITDRGSGQKLATGREHWWAEVQINLQLQHQLTPSTPVQRGGAGTMRIPGLRQAKTSQRSSRCAGAGSGRGRGILPASGPDPDGQ